jgi:hypothetical protein
MTDLVANEYGVEFANTQITRLRIHRTDGKWLVEYQRVPQWPLKLDALWWFNDGTYIEYTDALARIDYLRSAKYVSKAQFQKTKVFEVE